MAILEEGPMDVHGLVERIYSQYPKAVHHAARSSTQAALDKMTLEGSVGRGRGVYWLV